MAEISGYNCEQVNALRDVINTTCQNAGEGIVEILHDEIIVPMSTVWYAPEAVTFFEGLADTVQSCGEGIQQAFDSFRGFVQEAGANWAENTGGEVPSLATIDSVDLILSTSEIQENNNGNVTIDEGQAESIAASLESVEENIKSKLENLAEELNAETAFIGHGQDTAIQNCFVLVSGAIAKIFDYLSGTEDESLEGQIKLAVEKYQTVSEDISSAFNNASVE